MLEAIRTAYGRYYETPAGQFPSVTTILSNTLPGGKAWGLRKWKRENPEYSKQVLDEARSKGEAVHAAAEAALSGEEPDWTDVPADARIAAESLIATVTPGIDEIWEQEIQVYSEIYGYAGRLDFAGVWNCRHVVMDWKTSRKKLYPSGIHDYYMQVAAYALAYEEMRGVKIHDGVIFCAVHGLGCQPPFEFEIADWTQPFLNRLELFRDLEARGQLREGDSD